MFSEPPQTQYDLRFSVLGVNVRVHPMFWLVSLIMGANSQNANDMLIWVLAVFLCILVHEMGHALAFRYYGTPSHVVLHSFGGLAIPEGRGRHGIWPDIWISLWGPLAGFGFAAATALALQWTGHHARVSLGWPVPLTYDVGWLGNRPLTMLVHHMMYINIYWGMVNLLPVYPLDGGQIARGLFLRYSTGNAIHQSLILSTLVAAGVAVYAAAELHQNYLALFFGYMAFVSFQQAQSFGGRGGFGGGGGW